MFRWTGAMTVLPVACLAVSPALADFRISPAGAAPAVIADAPHVSPDDREDRRSRRNPVPAGRLSAKPATLSVRPIAKGGSDVVRGFGASVPLAFACRQIVPAGVRVAYGPGVDAQTPVDWLGGRPWAAVLRDAVSPAGLNIVPRGQVIEIRR